MSLAGPARRLACGRRLIELPTIPTPFPKPLHPGPLLVLPVRPCVFPTHASIQTEQQWRTQPRGFSSTTSTASPDDNASPSNPVLEEYLKKHPLPQPGAAKAQQPQVSLDNVKRGDLGGSSIFEDEERESALERGASGEGDQRDEQADAKAQNRVHILDPDPGARERWERKMVIQSVRRRGRVGRDLLLARTERTHTSKSHSMKTSVKKLGKLARQIAGKPLDDALVQMRLSRKKVAKDVLEQLQFARDEAVVSRGMGLGLDRNNKPRTENESDSDPPKPIDIQLKNGKRYTVVDPSKIYIDQAWVGRAPYGKLAEFRARGKTNVLRPPFTHLSVVLKEEATRIREWREREQKRRIERERHVWKPLPDRPVNGHRQWYSW